MLPFKTFVGIPQSVEVSTNRVWDCPYRRNLACESSVLFRTGLTERNPVLVLGVGCRVGCFICHRITENHTACETRANSEIRDRCSLAGLVTASLVLTPPGRGHRVCTGRDTALRRLGVIPGFISFQGLKEGPLTAVWDMPGVLVFYHDLHVSCLVYLRRLA